MSILSEYNCSFFQCNTCCKLEQSWFLLGPGSYLSQPNLSHLSHLLIQGRVFPCCITVSECLVLIMPINECLSLYSSPPPSSRINK
ncbi:hypothetical protein NC651_016435 [Populus alba x Populus x berolinensis]|nr:hypothetical protein NC651_016435 [Populus alba x Populus x berolinensis]